jgi:hypothetical protein
VFRLDLTPEQTAALIDQFHGLIAAGINHPNIAAPIAAGLQGGAAYLAHEHAVGDSLDVVLRERGPMAIEDAVPLIESLSAAIDHAASRGVHHGSLHLRDIILSPDGARMTGFGIAAALSQVSAKLPTRPQYSSPGGPSDMYSLGAIALEAVTGKRASADSLKEFEAEHASHLHGAFGAALAAFGGVRMEHMPTAREVADVPTAPAVPMAPAALAPPIALPTPVIQDLDLRIDRAADLMPGPSRLFETADDSSETPSRRWPIVIMFLAFGILAAVAVGFLLRTPTPVAVREPAAGVEETTVDLPMTSSPAPAPSRPASGAVAAPPKPLRGSLLIRSTPADADVFLNGQVRGKTPLAMRDLALGSYTIRVVREGYVADERKLQLSARRPTMSTTIELRALSASRTAKAEAKADGAAIGTPGTLNVQSRPAGARVFLNGRLVGSTPLAVPELAAGPATVRIEMDGYEPWTTTVRIAPGEQARVAASLERK